MAGEEKRALIAYFSWSGNTEALAELIQEQTGGDLYKITTATPYTEDYDVIFVGYPNRRSDAPMAALTFLESYDFNGKTLIPFCTNGSGVFGRSLSSVEKSAWGAQILDGFETSGGTAAGAGARVTEWLTTAGMGQRRQETE